MKFVANLRALLIALWLGGALLFIGVAQGAFAVLPTRELAGMVVSRTLMIVNFSGLIIAVLLLVASFLIKRPDVKPIWIWAERIFLILVAAAGAVGQFVIALYLSMIRNQFGGKPIDEIALEDPLRIQFNTWHQYSVWVLMAGMIAALIVYFIITQNASAGAPKKENKTSGFELPDDLKI